MNVANTSRPSKHNDSVPSARPLAYAPLMALVLASLALPSQAQAQTETSAQPPAQAADPAAQPPAEDPGTAASIPDQPPVDEPVADEPTDVPTVDEPMVDEPGVEVAEEIEDAGETMEEAAEEAAEEPESKLHVGGALRFSYFVKSWEGQGDNRKRFGDLAFDTFRLNADGSRGPLSISAEYRFYQGYHMLHHGYMGYVVSDDIQVDVGVSQVPFGLLKYASHNWFFDLTYYLGMEDDYDLGVRTSMNFGDAQVQLGFYKNSEHTYTGNTLASSRYSYDVVPTTVAELGYAGLTEDRYNSESNQANLRAIYTLRHGESATTEVGASARLGGLYNSQTDKFGYHWAAAAHASGTYGPVNVQLQGIAYAFEPENPAGQDDSFVIMGAYDAPYMVAAKGYVFNTNLSYTVPLTGGLVDSLTFYNDYSVLLKAQDGFASSHQNVTGMLVVANPIYTYIDVANGLNQPWLGPNYGDALAAATADDGWHTRFNINVGWYF